LDRLKRSAIAESRQNTTLEDMPFYGSRTTSKYKAAEKSEQNVRLQDTRLFGPPPIGGKQAPSSPPSPSSVSFAVGRPCTPRHCF